ncbi:MAG: prolipoprotein diacylglyceryl transferase [Dehalococcoidia bacterium]|nr:prolipoprotein diacylglyceryl transferase [Dehalococcoidia bacterium]
MPALLHVLTITIGWDPNIAKFGSLQLTWHGIFTAVGIALGVYLGVWLGRRQGFTEDDGYSIALVGVPAGIIGARAMFVLENRAQFAGRWVDVLRINEGGITLYGAIVGGVLAAVIYGLMRKLPVRRGLDAAGFGLLLGMAVGRIGDLINGEHISKVSHLPWAVLYSNPNSTAWQLGPMHPATTYELIGDLLIIGLMAALFAKFWRSRPGVAFFSGVVLYSAMRFGVSYLRVDSTFVVKDWITFPQAVSMGTWLIGMVGLGWTLLRRPERSEPAQTAGISPPAKARTATRSA